MTDYLQQYLDFVKAKRAKYGEVDTFAQGHGRKLQAHHVLPKKLGGANGKSNYVWLNQLEHQTAHSLLNLAFIQRNRLDLLRKLGYSALHGEFDLDLSIFRNARVTVACGGGVETFSFRDLCTAFRFLGGADKKKNMRAALLAAAFGRKSYGRKIDLKMHKRADRDILSKIRV